MISEIRIKDSSCQIEVERGRVSGKTALAAKYSIAMEGPKSGCLFRIACNTVGSARRIGLLWGKEVSVQPPDSNSSVYVVEGRQRDRWVRDIESESEELRCEHVPLTLVKQAVRWQYATRCHQLGYAPFHGAVIALGKQLVGIVGASGSGKSYLVDQLLTRYKDAYFVVDDWCLIDTAGFIWDPRQAYLHLRERQLQAESVQLWGSSPKLLEVCENPAEQRYICAVNELVRFRAPIENDRLSTIFLLDRVSSPSFRIDREKHAFLERMVREDAPFADISNRLLSESSVHQIAGIWGEILDNLPSMAIEGHRNDLSALIKMIELTLDGTISG
jgi:hypothetical protein